MSRKNLPQILNLLDILSVQIHFYLMDKTLQDTIIKNHNSNSLNFLLVTICILQ